jgi:carbonic anhydrase
MRTLARVTVAAVLSFLPTFALASENKLQCTAPEALEKLLEGNKRYVEGKFGMCKDSNAELREKLAKGQTPYAIVLSCSDSRLPPEVIFDKAPGEIFVIRVAGNTVDPVILASIEYAAEHLGTPLIFVLGHERCGAVTAAVDASGKKGTKGHSDHEASEEQGEKKEGKDNMSQLVTRLAPAVAKAKGKNKGVERGVLVEAAVDENIKLVAQNLTKQSAVLKKLAEEGKVQIAIGKYDLDDGKVSLLGKQKCSWVYE